MNAQVMPSGPQPAANLPVTPGKSTSKTGETPESGGGGAGAADLFAALLAGLLGQAGGGPRPADANAETQEGNLDAGAAKTAGGGSESAKASITDATWMMLGGLTATPSVASTANSTSVTGPVESSPSAANGSSIPVETTPAAESSQGSVLVAASGVSPAPTDDSAAKGGADAARAGQAAVGLGEDLSPKANEASVATTTKLSGDPKLTVTTAETPVASSESGTKSTPSAASQDASETLTGSGTANTPNQPTVDTPVASDGFDEARPDIISQTFRVQQSAGRRDAVSAVDETGAGQSGESAGSISSNLRAEASRGESRKVAQSHGERTEVPEGAESGPEVQSLGRRGLDEEDSGALGQKGGEQPGAARGESLREAVSAEKTSGHEAFQLRSQTTAPEVTEPERLSRNAVSEQPVQRLRTTADDFVPAIRRAIPAMSEGTRSEMQIQLIPEHLGKVTLKVAVVDGMVTARFNVENGAVKQLVESRLPELRQALESQGLRLDTINVGLGSDTGGFGGAFSQADVPNPRRFANAIKGYDAPAEDQLATAALGTAAAMQAGLGGGRGSVVDALA